MDYFQKEYVINQIAVGRFFIEYGDSDLFVYEEPNIDQIIESQLKYPIYYKNCLNNGFITKEEEQRLLKVNMIWLDEDEKKLITMQEDIGKLRKDRPAFQFQEFKLKQIDSTIKLLEDEIAKSVQSKHMFYGQTAEFQANLLKNYDLLRKNLFKNGALFWPSEKDFESFDDEKFIFEMYKRIFNDEIFDEKTIREVARSEPWRTRWKTATKIGDPLFGVNISLYGSTQRKLCYWSNVYDNVFDSIDCPSSEVIDNDEALNKWFIEQQEKYDERRKERDQEAGRDGISNKKIADSQEIFIKVDTQNDAQKVYNTLNTPEAKNRIRMRQEYLLQKGVVKEAEMPDTRASIKMELNRMAMAAGKGK